MKQNIAGIEYNQNVSFLTNKIWTFDHDILTSILRKNTNYDFIVKKV